MDAANHEHADHDALRGSREQDFAGGPLEKADSKLHRVIRKQAERTLTALPTTETFTQKVRDLAAAEIASGTATVAHIAKRLGVSPRTLTRKLEREGTTYKELLEHLRKTLEMRYFESRDLQLSEGALRLGCSQSAAFHRTFRRWTGQPPLQHRRRQLRQARTCHTAHYSMPRKLSGAEPADRICSLETSCSARSVMFSAQQAMVDKVEDGAADGPHAQRIANRYEVHELLGRGGMASVYRVTDVATGRQAALKQLLVPDEVEQRAGYAALFEREFHTLAELCHPRVIAVYDYGVSPDTGPYYTMELLDGGDLRERAPLPWREACTLLFDVCSSLALLHSRRLLHRDISPRNVRCTRDGKAKLIDFGAMAPMGAGNGQIVGTPAFTPPETVHRSALDGRADLFSLGATMYYALTGKLAYPARSFAEVIKAWTFKPAPPSARVSDIPVALDDLVMSLISIEPALRPQTAFDVMQRLAAIAGLECSEPEGVSRAYLSAPSLVGRADTLAALREKLALAKRGRGGGGVFVRAAPGLGRSRSLDACTLEAKTLGATVLRAKATGIQDDFAVALALTRHLVEALPSDALEEHFPELFESLGLPPDSIEADDALRARSKLKSLAELRADPVLLQDSICRFIRAFSKTHLLVVGVDDVHRIDEPSAAVLAKLVDEAHQTSLLVVLTAEADTSEAKFALEVLTRRCDELSLDALTRPETRTLFSSMFGDAANLDMLVDEIYRLAHGNPQQCMDLAQHLIDKHVIKYTAGTWTLPGALAASDLPSSAEEAILLRIEAFSPLARFLAEAQALAFHEVLTHADYCALCPDMDSTAIEAALAELTLQQALVSDGTTYSLANRVWTAAFKVKLGSAARQLRHRALAELYRSKSNTALIHHLFEAGLDEQGLDAMIARNQSLAGKFDVRAVIEMNAVGMGPSYLRAIETATKLGRPPRVVNELRRWLVALSVASDPSYYWLAAPALLEQLKEDAGLNAWRHDVETNAAGERISRALASAHEHYLATPEAERVYRADEAIRFLAQYVACSLPIGARTMNWELISTLPELLEPFAPLSPVLNAIWQNAVGTRELLCESRYDRARLRWIEVVRKLDETTNTELEHVETIRNAVGFAVGMTEAVLGLASATGWAARIEHDPLQRLSAMYLRKIVRLEQGDWSGADKLRRQAEVLALQARAPQMFTSVHIELAAYAHARDLVGLKEVIARLEPLAARYENWRPYLVLAEARFQFIRGDITAAKAGFEHCLTLTGNDAKHRAHMLLPWIGAQAGHSEALLALGDAEGARACAGSALAICKELDIDAPAHELTRALALAEAKLGDTTSAVARIDELIQRQTALGVSGLKLGVSYETRAQIAIWCDDENAFERYARLTAQEYRYGAHSPLGARYDRLVNEARRGGFQMDAGLSEFESTTMGETARAGVRDAATALTTAMAGTQRAEERSLRALRLVCESRAAAGGHFYVVRPEGLALMASHRMEPPPARLGELVHEYLLRERDRSETATVVVTSTLLGDLEPDHSTVQAGAATYALLLVACTLGGVGKIAGVIAVAPGEQPVQSVIQGQLLASIAAHLVQAGDSPGALMDRP
jgi:AraC-like DNA-binding protein